MRHYFSKQFVQSVVTDNFIFIRLVEGCVMTPIDEIAAPQFLPTSNKHVFPFFYPAFTFFLKPDTNLEADYNK